MVIKDIYLIFFKRLSILLTDIASLMQRSEQTSLVSESINNTLFQLSSTLHTRDSHLYYVRKSIESMLRLAQAFPLSHSASIVDINKWSENCFEKD